MPVSGLTRRELCVGLAGLGAQSLLGCRSDASTEPAARSSRAANTDGGRPSFTFDHGVASFDPSNDGVLLWTRVSGADEPVKVSYIVARDPDLRDVVDIGTAKSDPDADHTVVQEISGLDSGAAFYYAFSGEGATSAIARFRTVPAGALESLRLGIVCCSNYAYGYFAAYAEVARRNDLDAVLHLGDYIYEFGPGQYDDPDLPRAHEPPHEAVTLGDYRARYAQYRRDQDLQELHRQHSMLTIWDDHEFADDSWRDGADNHQPDEGAWSERRAAAAQAYLEWVPLRRRDDGAIYRSLRWGDLADLVLLDTRHAGRDEQPSLTGASRDPGRQMLGAPQEEWLAEALARSVIDDVPWRLVGQQVMVAPLTVAGRVLNVDQWDGYPTARARLLDLLDEARDCVVLTGDIHSSWAMDLPRDLATYDRVSGQGSVGVELVAPAVTSPGLTGALATAASEAARLLPHIRWADLRRRGFVVVDVDRERMQADWYHLEDVTTRAQPATYAAGFVARRGSPHLEPAAGPLPPRPGPDRAP